ncbi:MAG: LpxI family protein [PVC group bacterium]|nr:LpxI family protein [PVC group bacterium]
MEKIGLIAGNGEFPLLFAKGAKAAGISVLAIGIKEETSKELENLVDSIHWISVGQLKTLIDIFKKEEIKKAVMAGQIRHKLLFSDIELDEELKTLLLQLKDKKTDTILGAVALRLKQLGIELIDSSTFLKDYLPEKGILTQTKPTEHQWQDVSFGLEIAKTIAGLDIGQSVVVKDKVVLAVEAIEGTDEAISRGNLLCKGGAVAVKVSKPNQDMRFDIPLIGKRTIETLINTKTAVLAIEAGKTLFLDREHVLKLADKHGISIVAV